MKLVIETEDYDEIHDLINSAPRKRAMFDLHTVMRNYIKYAERDVKKDESMIDYVYAELCKMVYED